MLKGLEISEVRLRDVLNDNPSERIDAEYFLKRYLQFSSKIDIKHWNRFESVAEIKGGKRLPLGEDFSQEGTPYIRAEDVKNGFVEYENAPLISYQTHEKIKQYQTGLDDVLLTNVGNSIGDVGIVKFDIPICNLTENCVRAVCKGIAPDYLFAFLRSKYGQLQIERERVGTAQPKLAIERIRRFYIACLSKRFQCGISNIIIDAHGKSELSKRIYHEAEQSLLSELGFDGWTPVEESVSVKNCSDFMSAGRFDAEYFQPKYDEIVAKIKTYLGGTIKAASVLVTGLVNESEDTPERYVELADIGVSGEIAGCTDAMFGGLPSRARQRMATGQVIASSIEGSLDRCALVTPEYDKALCSTGFHRFSSQDINPETMLLLFKSWPIQQLMKRGCSGTILCGILSAALEHVDLPVVNPQVQKVLAAKVRESFALRAESKRLLDLAKRAVEVAIEQGEETAIAML